MPRYLLTPTDKPPPKLGCKPDNPEEYVNPPPPSAATLPSRNPYSPVAYGPGVFTGPFPDGKTLCAPVFGACQHGHAQTAGPAAVATAGAKPEIGSPCCLATMARTIRSGTTACCSAIRPSRSKRKCGSDSAMAVTIKSSAIPALTICATTTLVISLEGAASSLPAHREKQPNNDRRADATIACFT